MNDSVLRRELRRIAIEANHRCFGCGFEDSCGARGCAIIRQALERLELYGDAMPLERARELAQAEKDGQLLVLTCKVGDILYHISFGSIIETKVRTFFIGHPSHNIEKRDLRMIRTDRFDIPMGELGKTFFLAREEAEAALKKREADNEVD